MPQGKNGGQMRFLRPSLVIGVLLLAVLAGSARAAPIREAALDVASCGVDEFTVILQDAPSDA
jgi:hypothetical protein